MLQKGFVDLGDGEDTRYIHYTGVLPFSHAVLQYIDSDKVKLVGGNQGYPKTITTVAVFWHDHLHVRETPEESWQLKLLSEHGVYVTNGCKAIYRRLG
jgi:hypothetical protein